MSIASHAHHSHVRVRPATVVRRIEAPATAAATTEDELRAGRALQRHFVLAFMTAAAGIYGAAAVGLYGWAASTLPF